MKGYHPDIKPSDVSSLHVTVLVTLWNAAITQKLCDSACNTLLLEGFNKHQVSVVEVPGCFELPLSAKWALKKSDAVIAIGCLIKGDTPHFEYIAQSCAWGLQQVSLEFSKPCIFGVLTVLNETQAWDRTDSLKAGDKGAEAAYTLIQMLNLKPKG